MALTEIEALGYLKRSRITNDKGQFNGYVYDIYEQPQTAKPYAEKPNTAKPNTDKPPQLNTKQLNTYDNKELINNIVDYLNEKAGTSYRANSKQTAIHINARLKEGYSFDDFKRVIDKKCADWLTDSKMCEYLRPSTLFGTKFEQYLNSKSKTIITETPAETFKTEVFNL